MSKEIEPNCGFYPYFASSWCLDCLIKKCSPKAKFIKRLKKMLERYPDTACGHCPTAKYYNPTEPPEGCYLCQTTMGLEYVQYVTNNGIRRGACPCHRLTPEEAVIRAWKVIREFEREIRI